ncbi:hypothetical protein CCHL11_03234 [Colletotrichum chlorophyti]|uniref:Uncharacterized protein n=1 Tax=Colletotrichum chlorophyti TaxID=708187 RepID=A0A1Q8S3W9_9PEZI|nr:hypothetical protein CCHL11_03234 [Colletotrichum chlorophyti]
MKTTTAYIVAAALFGATQAAINPVNNIIRHEYNLNARAGGHGNLFKRRGLEEHTPEVEVEAEVLQPVV